MGFLLKKHPDAVIFDLFGTLIQFGLQQHPFRQLLKWARENGRPVRSDDACTIMTINGDVRDICRALGISPPLELLQKIEEQIAHELLSLSLYDDVFPILDNLAERGIKVGICSNLSQPYGIAIDQLLTGRNLQRFLSYELGVIKPNPEIYNLIIDSLGCKPKECLFVGDTYEADYQGPVSRGMKALYLVRKEPSNVTQINSLLSIVDYIDSL